MKRMTTFSATVLIDLFLIWQIKQIQKLRRIFDIVGALMQHNFFMRIKNNQFNEAKRV